jgi:hypothetical protein
MNQKNVLLSVVVAVLATIYVVYFTDWFRHKTLHIFHTARNLNPEHPADGLIFGLEGKYPLKEIKVVPLTAYQTNANVLPLWHLTAKNHSVPTGYFYYGQGIAGMAPAIAGDEAQPLELGVTYRIIVSIGKTSGFHDFTLGGAPPAADAAAGH